MRPRILLIAAEDTEQAAHACEWALKNVYRQGDQVHLVYVVNSLMPPMEVFHGTPGTAYTFTQPGEHKELALINQAKAALEARYLPLLRPQMVPYQLQLYAERVDAPPDRVGELLLKRADQVEAALVVLAAHNKPAASHGYAGSVAQYIRDNCLRPLAVVRPPQAEDWEEVEAEEGEEEVTASENQGHLD